MILLLGGTSETGPIARRLCDAGYSVLVSTATDEPLDLIAHPRLRRRHGRLGAVGLALLIAAEHVSAIIDAAHPYAANAHATAAEVTGRLRLPYFTFVRAGMDVDAVADANVQFAADHAAAATIAFSFNRPVLLTTGVNHLSPYVEQSAAVGVRLVVRVLPREESLQTCRDAGIPADRIIALKGPFSVDENRDHIRRHGIGVIVTKDSGEPGGVPQKIEAARLENCRIVIVRRPPAETNAHASHTIDELVAAVARALPL